MTQSKLDFIKFSTLIGLILLAVIFGGTSQDLSNYKQFVYLYSLISLITFTVLMRKNQSPTTLRPPLKFVAICFCISLFYIIPLPTFIVANLPGRDLLFESFDLLGVNPKLVAASFAPEKTRLSILYFLPIMTVIVLLSKMNTWLWIKTLVWIFPALALTLSFIGYLQTSNIWNFELYRISNNGFPVAFFANVNHMGTFLVMSLPMSLYLFYRHFGEGRHILTAFLSVTILFTLFGIYATQSGAAYFLLFLQFCIILIAILDNKLSGRLRNIVLAASLIFVAVFFYLGNFTSDLSHRLTAGDDINRISMFQNSMKPLKENFPFGTGLGTFEDVYKAYETSETITYKYSNEAHNDYLQIVLEMGVFGLAAVLIFLWAFFRVILKTFRNKNDHKYLRLAAANSMLVVLLHSGFDYPLRTLTIAVLFTLLSCIVFGNWKEPYPVDESA